MTASRIPRVDPGSAPFVLRLFGPFEARFQGAPLPPTRTRKSQWLLALLALRAGAEVDRAWLSGTLWPESPPHQTLATLRRTLTDLRQALGEQAWRLRSPTARRSLSLDLTDAVVDVLRFDFCIARGDPASLAEAVGYYRGPLLEGCPKGETGSRDCSRWMRVWPPAIRLERLLGRRPSMERQCSLSTRATSERPNSPPRSAYRSHGQQAIAP